MSEVSDTKTSGTSLISSINQSGSGIDLSDLVDGLVTAETFSKQESLSEKVEATNLQISFYGQLNTKLDTLSNSLSTLESTTARTTVSSNTAVSLTVTNESIAKDIYADITVSSVAGLRGGTGRSAYGASKGGIIALTKVLAIELSPYNITVNTLCPGAIETELVKNMHDKETRRAFLEQIPQKRYGLPEEVASAALFFTLPGSSYINGTIFPIDGGFSSSGIIKNELF